MNLNTITFYPYGPRYKYPHMMPRDIAIWERFLEANPSTFDRVAYDVKVGEGTPMRTVMDGAYGGDVNPLYQRKIDVLAEKDGELFIIEVKPNASSSAIGQVQGYVALFERDFKPAKRVHPIVLTDNLLNEMPFLAKVAGVQVLIA